MKKYLFSLTFLFVFFCRAMAGVPEIDPTPILIIEGIGNGYSTPAITSDRIYITGEKEGVGWLFAYDLKGNLLWEKQYGAEWADNFRGSRAAPVVADSLIYTLSAMGDVTCFSTRSGEKRWSLNMIRDLRGVNAVFGYSMPVLVEKERLYLIPGGPDTNIVCLDRYTGKLIWISDGNGETPGYASPLFVRHHNRNLLITFSDMAMLGLDAESGKLLWSHELSIKGNLPCNSMIYSEGFLYIVAGSGNGAFKFKISEDGNEISQIWANEDFDTYFGGFVKIGNYLYGSADVQRHWWSIDAGTGKAADSLSFRIGATVPAEGKLVLYSQQGKIGLVKPDQGKMTLMNTFSITKGTKEHFSLPIVVAGRLYVRHGNALVVYDQQQLTSN